MAQMMWESKTFSRHVDLVRISKSLNEISQEVCKWLNEEPRVRIGSLSFSTLPCDCEKVTLVANIIYSIDKSSDDIQKR